MCSIILYSLFGVVFLYFIAIVVVFFLDNCLVVVVVVVVDAAGAFVGISVLFIVLSVQ